MDGGSLNVRNDELFDKLDSAPKKDVNKLIQLQKETSSNNIKKQIKDSVTAIEETLFTLDIVNSELNDQVASKTTEKTDDDHNKTTFELLVNNLNNSNSDNFIKKIEKLYNIFYKCYESEVTIKKLSRSSIDEYVKNRILGRVMYNIHYLKNFTRHYEQERFADIIKKLKKIPKIHKDLHSIEQKFKTALNTLTGNVAIVQKKCSEVYEIIEKEEGAKGAAEVGAEKKEGEEGAAVAAAEVGAEKKEGEEGAKQKEDIELFLKAKQLSTDIIQSQAQSQAPEQALAQAQSQALAQTPEIKNYVILTIFIKLKTAKKEDKEDKEDKKYAKRAGENTLKILQDSIRDIKDQVARILLIDYYMVRNFEDTVDYFALETYYRIIFGTELSYDLKLFEENKYILTRLENIDDIYETIQTIAYDDTFRTLERLYFNKKIGHQNIFRIDTDTSLDIKVFDPQSVFKEPYDTYDSEPEQILRELVLLDINNGIVDRKKLQLFLMFIYDDKYIELYNFLSNIFNKSIELLIDPNKIDEILTSEEKNLVGGVVSSKRLRRAPLTVRRAPLTVRRFRQIIGETQNPLHSEGTSKRDDLRLDTSGRSSKMSNNMLFETQKEPELLSQQKQQSVLLENSEHSGAAEHSGVEAAQAEEDAEIKKTKEIAEHSGAALSQQQSKLQIQPTQETDINNLINELFLEALKSAKAKTKEKEKQNIIAMSIKDIKELVREYLNELEQTDESQRGEANMGQASNSGNGADRVKDENKELLDEIKQILNLKNDDDPGINGIKDIFHKYVSNNKIIGGSKIDIKREELEKNLNNTSLNDDLTESVTDNAKRKYKKLQRNIEKIFNAKENIEQDDNKLLDQEYLDILRDFNIDDIKTASYKDLREKLYKIKNNEYFEDIKITNEDIYTFIATTYVLRVISLYITMWFIQIEIVKDVHSVIVAYIITYILLFILIYTFVNLSDNQLDTSKSFLYYFYTRVNFSYTRFIVHLGLLLLLIIIPFVIRTIDKESSSYKHISDIEKRYLYTFITNMSIIVWVILSIIAFFFK